MHSAKTRHKGSDTSSSWEDSKDNLSLDGSGSSSSRSDVKDCPTNGPSLSGYCLTGKCSSWNILDSKFTFPTPKDYPCKYDKANNAPEPPIGRHIFDDDGKPIQQLHTVRLTLDWLEKVALFAYHQMSTKPPRGRSNQRFWTKGGCLAYLRTCGFVKRLAEAIYTAGKDGLPCPIPTTWKRSRSLEKNHFAGMHMLFLGHGKSNIVMKSKWMSDNELLAKFGRQANLVLRKVASLRLRRFAAHPLSTSSWGTGPWVSENYVFEMRCSKYFMTMPAIHKCPKRNRDEFETDYRVVQRFVSSSVACISAIMGSTEESAYKIRLLVPIYLDCMVEMDDQLTRERLNKAQKGRVDLETRNASGDGMVENSEDDSDDSNCGGGQKINKKSTKRKS